MWIAQTCDLLVKVKRMQIEAKKKNEAKKQKNAATSDEKDSNSASDKQKKD